MSCFHAFFHLLPHDALQGMTPYQFCRPKCLIFPLSTGTKNGLLTAQPLVPDQIGTPAENTGPTSRWRTPGLMPGTHFCLLFTNLCRRVLCSVFGAKQNQLSIKSAPPRLYTSQQMPISFEKLFVFSFCTAD